MEFSATERIGAPRDAVEAALADPAYYESLGSKLGSLERPELLGSSVSGGIVELKVRYAFAGDLSGAARLVVDANKLTWVIHTRLDLATHSAVLDVVPDHYGDLLVCDAVVRFDEEAGETIETVVGTLDVRVPFVGAAAERAIIDSFVKHLEGEAAALTLFCAQAEDHGGTTP